mmetsp:Transcript_17853/g.33666  ORF Transcript_17853/g.33666 Transcript_17853/m.33666 type:complete len:1135 (-) Transcript_17853:138-3542(-)
MCLGGKDNPVAENPEGKSQDAQDADVALQMYSMRLVQEREEESTDEMPCLYEARRPEHQGNTNSACRKTLAASHAAPPVDVSFNSKPTSAFGIQAKKLSSFQSHCVDLDPGQLCSHCRLPIGDVGHFANGREGPLVHGECMAQIIVQRCKEASEELLAKDAVLKSERREAYDIGWRLDHIPPNMVPAEMLGCPLVSQGMCALLLQNGFHAPSVVPTIAPAAAVNLEYLSIALRVRQTEGREPVFSLDPVENKHAIFDKDAMQVKRYEPEWLAGTSVGDVLFQSDYHLKELSMGEYDQPIVGMRNIHEYADGSELHPGTWSAREWFHVRDARVNVSQDNVLVPYVKMGVEAREQVYCHHGVEDAPITRKDHPMVQYADEFTRQFDLIAERKSVVHHLRELAKASVLAKFLVESQMQLPETWYNLAADSQECCSMEIPQLWNERITSKIEMKDGEIVRSDCPKHGVYGGVQFGLEKFQISQARAKKVKPVLIGEGTTVQGLNFTLDRFQLTQGKARTVTAQPGAVGFRQDVASLGIPSAAAAATTKVLRSAGSTEIKVVPITLPGVDAGPIPGAAAPGAAPAPGATMMPSAGAPGQAFQVFTAPRRVAAILGPPSRSATGKIKGVTPLKKVGVPAFPTAIPGLSAAPLAAGLSAPGVGLSTSSLGLGSLGRPSLGALRPSLSAAPRVYSPMSTTDRIASVNAPPRIHGISPIVSVQPSLVSPQGVDLNLDQFNLSTAEELTSGGAYQLKTGSQERSIAINDSFWSEVDRKGCGSVFAEEDRQMFREIFNPYLSDRREEGEFFAPPDPSFSYMNKLRILLEEEKHMQEQRKDHFFSNEFQVDNAGPLFPLSWISPFEITSETVQRCTPNMLHPRPDYIEKAGEIIKAARPMFEKCTEDGIRFRIYRVGSLEVRTTQAYDDAEVVGVVFAIRRPSQRAALELRRVVQDSECISKVTEYVEHSRQQIDKLPSAGLYDCCYYTVLETQQGNVIVTEKVNGTVSWEENPVDLEDRNSLAKVLRAGECNEYIVTVQDFKSFCAQSMHRNRASRLYAQDVFIAAMGSVEKVTESYIQREASGQSRMVPEQLDAVDPYKSIEEATVVCQCCCKVKDKQDGRTGAPGSGLEDTWACNGCWKDLKQ